MALFHILIDVCRVLVNVVLLLRTCTEDDSPESRGRPKKEVYFNLSSGLIHHFERQLQGRDSKREDACVNPGSKNKSCASLRLFLHSENCEGKR